MTIQIITTPEAMQEVFNQAFEEAVKKFQNSIPQPIASQHEERFNINQLADYLKCTKATIHAYKKRGVFPYYQTGRTVYFIKSEVDLALASDKRHKKNRLFRNDI